MKNIATRLAVVMLVVGVLGMAGCAPASNGAASGKSDGSTQPSASKPTGSKAEIGVPKRGGPFEFTVDKVEVVDEPDFTVAEGDVGLLVTYTVKNVDTSPAAADWALVLETDTLTWRGVGSGSYLPQAEQMAPGEVFTTTIGYDVAPNETTRVFTVTDQSGAYEAVFNLL